jgi:hypothetical protein
MIFSHDHDLPFVQSNQIISEDARTVLVLLRFDSVYLIACFTSLVLLYDILTRS